MRRKRSDKALRLSQNIGKLIDQLYEEFGSTSPSEIYDAKRYLDTAATNCLVASHFLREREAREQEFKKRAA